MEEELDVDETQQEETVEQPHNELEDMEAINAASELHTMELPTLTDAPITLPCSLELPATAEPFPTPTWLSLARFYPKAQSIAPPNPARVHYFPWAPIPAPIPLTEPAFFDDEDILVPTAPSAYIQAKQAGEQLSLTFNIPATLPRTAPRPACPCPGPPYGLPARVFSTLTHDQPLYPWQTECLKAAMETMDNFLYTSPTGSGKSLVADTLALHALAQGVCVIYIAPFVSLVQERADTVRPACAAMDVPAEPLFGPKVIKSAPRSPTLIVCTPEKAVAVLDSWPRGAPTIGLVVVDEVHVVGDGRRGALLETIMAKIVYSQTRGAGMRLIATTATLPNPEEFATWLRAGCYVNTLRPIALSTFIVTPTRILDAEGTVLHTLPPSRVPSETAAVVETVNDRGNVLVFVSSRARCSSLASSIAAHLAPPDPTIAPLRAALVRELAQNVTVSAARSLEIMAGVGFHHAGLLQAEKSIMERAFRERVLSVLVCTTTLAAGVNLPARRVVISGIKVGREPLDSTRFHQAAGRAGRPGFDSEGVSIITVSDDDAEKAAALASSSPSPAESCLVPMEAVVSAACAGLTSTVQESVDFLACTLRHIQRPFDAEEIETAARELVDMKAVQVSQQRLSPAMNFKAGHLVGLSFAAVTNLQPLLDVAKAFDTRSDLLVLAVGVGSDGLALYSNSDVHRVISRADTAGGSSVSRTAAFLAVDVGSLLAHRTGQIPEASRDAVRCLVSALCLAEVISQGFFPRLYHKVGSQFNVGPGAVEALVESTLSSLSTVGRFSDAMGYPLLGSIFRGVARRLRTATTPPEHEYFIGDDY
ncbi:DEAD/DEAH box helicase [Carpediemonas membranifera]|uniref:DEAD/DEAH box helicase n=1 Tax=Carpediemonas membranifera TaxID=201153 RepID=A0A8J6BA40_9EUKA|nr:DEAD/DEAH box helicase [Carpediemonas membranifera]|eukprot:KAG9393117.1 DEAD/DEAH box helicase [Carpediemonas membranifera]